MFKAASPIGFVNHLQVIIKCAETVPGNRPGKSTGSHKIVAHWSIF